MLILALPLLSPVAETDLPVAGVLEADRPLET